MPLFAESASLPRRKLVLGPELSIKLFERPGTTLIDIVERLLNRRDIIFVQRLRVQLAPFVEDFFGRRRGSAIFLELLSDD